MKMYRQFVLMILCLFLAGESVLAVDFRFGANGKFKIVQVTDSHIKADSEYSKTTVEMLNKVLDAEKPDLVIFTGDVVTGKPYKAGFELVIEPVLKRKIPYAVEFGNHDDEQDLTRSELADLLMKYPGNVSQLKKIDGVSGYGNYVLEVKGRDGKKTEALLYCMDSHAYSTLKSKQLGGYGWFTFDQIEWYRKQSDQYTAKNNGKPFPALAFFHIPLPEYKEAYKDTTNKMIGTQMEKVCSPDINSGMFLAMLEKGDVMGTFVGHDHNNDYIFDLYGIALAYGHFSGSKTTYCDLPNGVRVIELTEGEHGFTTWIRLNDATIVNKVKHPDDLFVDKSKKK